MGVSGGIEPKRRKKNSGAWAAVWCLRGEQGGRGGEGRERVNGDGETERMLHHVP